MYYHRTSNLQNPGAGDYVTEDTLIDLQRKSPRAVIGKERRFLAINEQMIENYRKPVPIQHVKDSSKVCQRKSQQGCIGNARRLDPRRFEIESPGVGAYNMSSFASLAAAKQSDFTRLDAARAEQPLTARPLPT